MKWQLDSFGMISCKEQKNILFTYPFDFASKLISFPTTGGSKSRMKATFKKFALLCGQGNCPCGPSRLTRLPLSISWNSSVLISISAMFVLYYVKGAIFILSENNEILFRPRQTATMLTLGCYITCLIKSVFFELC